MPKKDPAAAHRWIVAGANELGYFPTVGQATQISHLAGYRHKSGSSSDELGQLFGECIREYMDNPDKAVKNLGGAEGRRHRAAGVGRHVAWSPTGFSCPPPPMLGSITAMSTVPDVVACDGCGKPIDGEFPDHQKAGKITCLDCQSAILSRSRPVAHAN